MKCPRCLLPSSPPRTYCPRLRWMANGGSTADSTGLRGPRRHGLVDRQDTATAPGPRIPIRASRQASETSCASPGQAGQRTPPPPPPLFPQAGTGVGALGGFSQAQPRRARSPLAGLAVARKEVSLADRGPVDRLLGQVLAAPFSGGCLVLHWPSPSMADGAGAGGAPGPARAGRRIRRRHRLVTGSLGEAQKPSTATPRQSGPSGLGSAVPPGLGSATAPADPQS